jgi:hypothetical protein
MTTDLHELLRERAQAAPLEPLDVGALSRAGDRRLRRRRGLLVAGSAAAILLVAGGAVALGQRDAGTRSRQPASSPSGAASPGIAATSIAWSRGSIIHDGAQTIDVGRTIYRLVQTSSGFVFSDYQGRVLSWHDGEVHVVGTSGGPLTGTAQSPLAGWVEGTGKTLSFVVFDQATGAVIPIAGHSSSAPGPAPGGYENGDIAVIDGDTVYWRDGRQTYEATISEDRASTPRVLSIGARWLLLGVANGVAVLNDEDTGAIEVGRLADPAKLALRESSDPALLSPDGRWLVGESLPNQDPRVYDTATGAPTSLAVKAGFLLVYEWLDDDTVAVLSARTEHTDYQLLACSVTTGQCRVVVADLGEAPVKPGGGNGSGFALPIGDYYFPFPHG